MKHLGRALLILVLSLAGSYASAIVFIAVLYRTLPPSDTAYGHGLRATFSDPFVVGVARFYATAAGLVVFPIALRALRGRNPILPFAMCLGAAIATIAVATPILKAFGILAGILVVIFALRWCDRHQPQVRF
jgi:hypothetical protein